MPATSRSRPIREALGHFDRFLKGKGIDVGAPPDPLYPASATFRTWNEFDGDGQILKGIPDGSLDFLYSSHCLEHLDDIPLALQHWTRVVRAGGILFILVPDWTLYEKRLWPSKHNSTHRQTFSLELTREDVGRSTHWHVRRDLRPLLAALGVRVIDTALEDDGFDDAAFPADQTLEDRALAQIRLIARKER
ncbi:MAG: methyltransferase domain-containing protein [Egibacteraceae bacterium]